MGKTYTVVRLRVSAFDCIGCEDCCLCAPCRMKREEDVDTSDWKSPKYDRIRTFHNAWRRARRDTNTRGQRCGGWSE